MCKLKKCECGGRLRVADSRELPDGIWRRRECLSCKKITYSIEIESPLTYNQTLDIYPDFIKQKYLAENTTQSKHRTNQ